MKVNHQITSILNPLDLGASLPICGPKYRDLAYLSGRCAACRLDAHKHLCMATRICASLLQYSLFFCISNFSFFAIFHYLYLDASLAHSWTKIQGLGLLDLLYPDGNILFYLHRFHISSQGSP